MKIDGSRSRVASSTPRDDADHLEAVDVALAAQAVAVDRLVHERQGVVRRVQVTHPVVHVDRLDRVARQEVDRVEQLRESQQVLVVLAVAGAPAAVEVGDVGRAPDRPERHPVAAELDVTLGVPGMERERSGRRLDRLGDHLRVEPNALRVGVGMRSCRLEHLAGIGIEEVHADLGQDAQRRDVDRLELVGGDDLGRRVAHPRLRPRPLLGQQVALVAGPTSRATASKALARGRIHVRHVDLPSACARGPAPDFSMLLVLAPQPTHVAEEGQQEVDEHHQQAEVHPGVVHPLRQEPSGVVGIGQYDVERRPDHEDRQPEPDQSPPR